MPFPSLAHFLTRGESLQSLQLSCPALPVTASPTPTPSDLPPLRELSVAVRYDFGSGFESPITPSYFFNGISPWAVRREVLKIRGVQKLAIQPWWIWKDREIDSGPALDELEKEKEDLMKAGTEVELKMPNYPCWP